ncbi:MAG: hypothetical protein JJV93_02760 [Alphaproteobacteria bacterium]|nr:hypothetical protein [Alphaproteobacteria bacterium]MBL0718150.1 hypothetical protein [Alphaproteobacteria bacterium]
MTQLCDHLCNENLETMIYLMARVIMTETITLQLGVKEALATMIVNRANDDNIPLNEILRDTKLFNSWNSKKIQPMQVPIYDPEFQVCLRTARRACSGLLHDRTLGSTAFHHLSESPEWTLDWLPIIEINPLVFYKFDHNFKIKELL